MRSDDLLMAVGKGGRQYRKRRTFANGTLCHTGGVESESESGNGCPTAQNGRGTWLKAGAGRKRPCFPLSGRQDLCSPLSTKYGRSVHIARRLTFIFPLQVSPLPQIS